MASRDGMARLLDQRVAPVIECDRRDDTRAPGLLGKLTGLRGRGGQRFIRDHVLSPGESRGDHWIVQVIRCRNMDDLDFRISDERFIAPVSFPRTKLLCFPSTRFFTATCD